MEPSQPSQPSRASLPTRTPDAVSLAAALRRAVEAGDVDATHRLLAEGADPNAADARGVTLLHRAASYGHESVAQVLHWITMMDRNWVCARLNDTTRFPVHNNFRLRVRSNMFRADLFVKIRVRG